MADESNFLSTPENYATPDQLKSTREYAKALLSGNGQQPVKHWSQGVSNMVAALVGGSLDYNAAQREKRALERSAMQQQVVIPGQNYPETPVGTPGAPTLRSPGEQGSPQMFPKTKGTVGNANEAVAGIESGGNYSLLGPVTKTGDRAYGKYQVMGSNVGPWTKEALGKELTPEQFVASPEAQDAVFKHKFGEYSTKYGPEGAARAWFAGEGGMNHPDRKDQLGTTVADYGRRFALAFNGPDGAAPAPAAAAIQEAAAKTAPKMPNPGVDVAPGGQQIVNPALIKQQPGYTQQQLQAVLANPWIDQKIKDQAMQLMLQRGQPITMDDPRGTGGKIMIDPNHPGTQQFFAPPPHYVKSKVGDIENDSGAVTYGPDGKPMLVRPPVSPTIGPRSDAGGAAPAVGPGGPMPGGAAPVVAGPNNAPAGPAEAPGAPVQVASNDPTAGIAAAGGEPKVELAAEGGGDGPGSTPLGKFAQAVPPGVDPEQWAADRALKRNKVNDTLDEEAGKKTIEFGSKNYDTLNSQGATARKLLPQIGLAQSMLHDPNFRGGWGRSLTDEVKRAKSALLGDKYANASNETFDKLMAGNVLDTMKTALGGLGQVRLAEIDLLNRANGTRNNGDASNEAILEISKRGLTKLDHIAGMSNEYMAGDEVVDPITGQTLVKANVGPDGEISPRRTLDANFNKVVRKFDKDHPSFTPEEIKNYQTLFDASPVKREEGSLGPQTPPAEIKVGTEKQFKQGVGVWDGKQWQPKNQQ